MNEKTDENNYIYRYYEKVLDGSIVVGRWIRLLLDRITAQLGSGELVFDQDKAAHAIEWIQTHCFHTEGPLAPGPFLLELWQKAFISCLFGLYDPTTGKRAYREAVLIIARKNGKSLLCSAIGKYVFESEGGYGTRVYCLAPKLDQADIIYNNIWHMITLDPEWRALKEAVEGSKDQHNKKTIDDTMLARHRQTDLSIPGTNSTVKKIAFNAKKSDGFNPSLAICDEIASWEGDKGLKQYEVMKSGMGAREMGGTPAILLSCSTAGYINDSIYDELLKRSTSVLLGTSEEKRLLPFLYIIDDVDKWDDLDELKKSNPNMGVSVSEDYLREEIAIAKGSLSKKAEFLCKYCNVKQNSSQAWLDYQTVDKACGEKLRLEDFRGCYCVGGIDLSQTTDLTSCCAVIERDGELYVFSRFFMPNTRLATASAEDGVPYDIYRKNGLLTVSGENYVDYHDCYGFFTELVEKYRIYPLKIGYDRYSAQYLIDDMKRYGFHCDDVYQGFNLTPVINEVDGILKDGILHIGDNSVLKIHFLNSAIKQDLDSQRKKLVKLGNHTRIDGMAALLDAMCVRQKYWHEIGSQLTNKR